MPGIFEVGMDVPIGKAIEDIILIVTCSERGARRRIRRAG